MTQKCLKFLIHGNKIVEYFGVLGENMLPDNNLCKLPSPAHRKSYSSDPGMHSVGLL